jgi:alkanesulfonate monooxygenase SsuD/methylene tetrahydromethanopterin reductase-like flavin-dependent oxidoreductase (luciferase family)
VAAFGGTSVPAAMRVGLFADVRNPPQWQRPWDAVYGALLERLEDAERIGISSVWLSEHHRFEDGYLPQPLTLAAAIAARTSKLRIGTAILQAPIRPAIDIAEQAALVDIISGGRLELGLGTGYRRPEWDAFGFDGQDRYGVLEERLREVRRLWREGGATPRPLQERPPLWVGCEGPRGARIAGRLGEGLLCLKRELLEPYREALAAAGHDPGSARMSGCANLLVAEDPERTWAAVEPHLRYQWQSYEDYAVEGTGREPAQVDAQRLRTSGPPILPRFDVVTPEAAVARVRDWLDGLPVEHVYFWLSIAGMPDDLVAEHVKLLAERVAPALAGRSKLGLASSLREHREVGL